MLESSARLVKNLAFLIETGKLSPESLLWHEIHAGRHVTVNELFLVSAYTGLTIDDLLFKDLAVLANLNLQKIKFLVLDVDGVMTDGGMMFTKNGDEIKKFNSKDGIAIHLCHNKGLKVGIISAGHHGAIVEKRANMLGIDRFYVGKRPKLDILKSWLNDMQLKPEEVAFIGDDVNDLPIIEYVGVSACPGDAVKAVKKATSINLTVYGGHGCVREFIDNYLV